jgi:hypothetical protein
LHVKGEFLTTDLTAKIAENVENVEKEAGSFYLSNMRPIGPAVEWEAGARMESSGWE